MTTEELVTSNLGLAKMLAASYVKRTKQYDELDDMNQFAALGLMNAAKKYDESKGVPFRAYAKILINGALIDGVHHQMSWLNAGSSRNHEGCPCTKLNESHIRSYVAVGHSPYTRTWHNERIYHVRQAILGLPKKLRLVIMLRYYDELSEKEIGIVLNVVECRISQMLHEAYDILKRKLQWLMA